MGLSFKFHCLRPKRVSKWRGFLFVFTKVLTRQNKTCGEQFAIEETGNHKIAS